MAEQQLILAYAHVPARARDGHLQRVVVQVVEELRRGEQALDELDLAVRPVVGVELQHKHRLPLQIADHAKVIGARQRDEQAVGDREDARCALPYVRLLQQGLLAEGAPRTHLDLADAVHNDSHLAAHHKVEPIVGCVALLPQEVRSLERHRARVPQQPLAHRRRLGREEPPALGDALLPSADVFEAFAYELVRRHRFRLRELLLQGVQLGRALCLRLRLAPPPPYG